MTDESRPGLGTEPKKEWPKVGKAELAKPAIARLTPGSDRHKMVLEYLNNRIQFSERKMKQFYDRWRVNELKYQAYIDLDDFGKQLAELNKQGKSALAVNITVPYAFSTINTIVTYLIHTFCGRKPIFQVSAAKGEAVEAAALMESKLQYDADKMRLVKKIYQFLMDSQIYSVGIFRCKWKNERKMRTVWREEPNMILGLPEAAATKRVKSREMRLTFAGNDVDTVDPFMFLPDPRVPMHEVNRRGEFVFWKTYEGKHTLKAMETSGDIYFVDAAGELAESNTNAGMPSSNRNLISGGDDIAGKAENNVEGNKNFMLAIQGTIMIVPNELGLGDGTPADDQPKRWIFTILNNKQIVQAEPFDYDHDMHPVAVTEPYSMGYGFGNPGMGDYLNPMQDLMSWFINSHVDNVRTGLNNMWLVDPSRVELQDLKKPGAGKIIRLKRSAYGQDVRQAIQQMTVQDMTRGHVTDFELLMRLTDAMSSVTDNLRGLQDSGGRKTATEVRTSGEASASRLAAQTRLISAQGMTDLAEQMSINNQQFLEEEFMLQVVGAEGIAKSQLISPEMLVGDFNYPIHDGTLPLDRVAMLDVWKEILMGVMQDPALRQRFDVFNIFKFIAELGGARNIEQFEIKVQPQSEEMIQQMAGQGQIAPMGQTGQTPGLNGSPPSERLIGGT